MQWLHAVPPRVNAEEKHRLQKLSVTIDGGYVDGKVQVSRALGDIESKTGDKINGLICKPEVTVATVKESTEFVVKNHEIRAFFYCSNCDIRLEDEAIDGWTTVEFNVPSLSSTGE